MRGHAGGAYQLLSFRENSLAVLPGLMRQDYFHFGNGVPQRNTLPLRAISFADRPLLQPFNSASIFGSNANFASAVALVKYSNPQEGPR